MQELNFGTFPQNAGLNICPGVIRNIKNAVSQVAGCAQTTFADIIQVGARRVLALLKPSLWQPQLFKRDLLPTLSSHVSFRRSPAPPLSTFSADRRARC